MDLKEADKVCGSPNAKTFIVRQDTNDLLAKGSETSEVLEVNDNLNGSGNPLYMNYLDTISLLNKKNAAE